MSDQDKAVTQYARQIRSLEKTVNELRTELESERQRMDALKTTSRDLFWACKEAVFLFAHGVGAMSSTQENSDRNIEAAHKIKTQIEEAIAKAEAMPLLPRRFER